eukprot:scaffold16066_cov109-Cylindrotheca_fusiformis.AAC.4
MKENKNNELKRSETKEEAVPEFFVYTSETRYSDVPKDSLTHLRVDSSVRYIREGAFNNCELLVHVQLPETLTRIGKEAFEACSKLKRVQFFSNDSSLGIVSSNNQHLEDGTIVFPKNAKLQIDEDAFLFCHSLRKIVIYSVSTKLGEAAFANCQALISVELPGGLQVIEPVFFNCGSLATVNIPSSVIKIGNDAFNCCRSLTSFDLPHGLLEIGERSFSGCESIEILQIPATVSTVGESAFQLCSRLKSIKLPPTLERIEDSTFWGCRSLEYIEIPLTVSSIGWAAFCSCVTLSHIRIPPTVDRMMDWTAFEDCSSLVSVELPEGLFITQAERFPGQSFGCSSLVNLAIPTLTDQSLGGCLRDSKLGSVVENNVDLNRKLKHRFDTSPLNKLCYYQPCHSTDDSILRLRSLVEDDPLTAAVQVDEFGMTPLHVLSLSQTPNMSMLLAVMKVGQLDHMIQCRDSFGSTPMDYLCLNRMPTSSDVIRIVLKSRFSDLLGLDRSWSSDMMQAVDEALKADWSSRRREIVAIYLKLAKYEQQEILSVMELGLWKIKIDDVIANEQTPDRQSCRIMSGASIVIPQVLPFLDKLDVEDYFASPDLTP